MRMAWNSSAIVVCDDLLTLRFDCSRELLIAQSYLTHGSFSLLNPK